MGILLLSNLVMAFAIAILALIAERSGRRPALAHGLWVLFFLKLVTPSLFPLALDWPAPETWQENKAHLDGDVIAVQNQTVVESRNEVAQAIELEEAHSPIAEHEPWPVADAPALGALAEEPGKIPWSEVALGLWLVGSCSWFLLAAVRLGRFRKQLCLALPAPPGLQEEVRELAGEMGVRCPELALLPGRLSPMLWVIAGKARLLIPTALLARLDDRQRRALLIHELAHWRRGDHWVRRLEMVALGLYWWCPLVWWARRRLQAAEEECCDAWVLWLMPGAGRDYALALVETLDFLAGARAALPPVASGIGHVRLLQRRLTMIMRGTTPRLLTVGGGLLVLGLGAGLLPLRLTWAQNTPPAGYTVTQPTPPILGVTEPPGTGAPEARHLQLDQAQHEINKMQHDLDVARQDLERRTRELTKRSMELRQMMDKLRAEADSRLTEKRTELKIGTRPGPGGSVKLDTAQPGTGEIDKRLREVERKLDRIIEYLDRRAETPDRPHAEMGRPMADWLQKPIPQGNVPGHVPATPPPPPTPRLQRPASSPELFTPPSP